MSWDCGISATHEDLVYRFLSLASGPLKAPMSREASSTLGAGRVNDRYIRYRLRFDLKTLPQLRLHGKGAVAPILLLACGG